jgi:hypothetical protein
MQDSLVTEVIGSGLDDCGLIPGKSRIFSLPLCLLCPTQIPVWPHGVILSNGESFIFVRYQRIMLPTEFSPILMHCIITKYQNLIRILGIFA